MPQLWIDYPDDDDEMIRIMKTYGEVETFEHIDGERVCHIYGFPITQTSYTRTWSGVRGGVSSPAESAYHDLFITIFFMVKNIEDR